MDPLKPFTKGSELARFAADHVRDLGSGFSPDHLGRIAVLHAPLAAGIAKLVEQIPGRVLEIFVEVCEHVATQTGKPSPCRSGRVLLDCRSTKETSECLLRLAEAMRSDPELDDLVGTTLLQIDEHGALGLHALRELSFASRSMLRRPHLLQIGREPGTLEIGDARLSSEHVGAWVSGFGAHDPLWTRRAVFTAREERYGGAGRTGMRATPSHPRSPIISDLGTHIPERARHPDALVELIRRGWWSPPESEIDDVEGVEESARIFHAALSLSIPLFGVEWFQGCFRAPGRVVAPQVPPAPKVLPLPLPLPLPPPPPLPLPLPLPQAAPTPVYDPSIREILLPLHRTTLSSTLRAVAHAVDHQLGTEGSPATSLSDHPLSHLGAVLGFLYLDHVGLDLPPDEAFAHFFEQYVRALWRQKGLDLPETTASDLPFPVLAREAPFLLRALVSAQQRALDGIVCSRGTSDVEEVGMAALLGGGSLALAFLGS